MIRHCFSYGFTKTFLPRSLSFFNHKNDAVAAIFIVLLGLKGFIHVRSYGGEMIIKKWMLLTEVASRALYCLHILSLHSECVCVLWLWWMYCNKNNYDCEFFCLSLTDFVLRLCMLYIKLTMATHHVNKWIHFSSIHHHHLSRFTFDARAETPGFHGFSHFDCLSMGEWNVEIVSKRITRR
jgi:hypothetical protein